MCECFLVSLLVIYFRQFVLKYDIVKHRYPHIFHKNGKIISSNRERLILMKELVINSSLNLIKNQCPHFSNEKLEEIEYGLVGLYLTITKTIVIGAIALMLGIFKELILFTLIYNIIRMPSFGLHATSSTICLISSAIIFLGISYICTIVSLSFWLKIIIGTISTLLIFKNSPADTEKRPIISPKRRLAYKLISTGVAISFITLSVVISNDFIANSLIFSLILQSFFVAPTIYKLFGLPYDNYKNYIATA